MPFPQQITCHHPSLWYRAVQDQLSLYPDVDGEDPWPLFGLARGRAVCGVYHPCYLSHDRPQTSDIQDGHPYRGLRTEANARAISHVLSIRNFVGLGLINFLLQSHLSTCIHPADLGRRPRGHPLDHSHFCPSAQRNATHSIGDGPFASRTSQQAKPGETDLRCGKSRGDSSLTSQLKTLLQPCVSRTTQVLVS